MKSPRRLLTLLLCSALILARLLGTHMHVEHQGETSQASHQEHALVVATDLLDAKHVPAHGEMGAIDASGLHNGNAKAPLLTTLALLCAAFVLFTLPFAGRHQAPPAYRSPIDFGRRLHLLPPSQAPPQPV